MTVALFAQSLRWLVKRPATDGVRRETERILRVPQAPRRDTALAAKALRTPRPSP